MTATDQPTILEDRLAPGERLARFVAQRDDAA